METLGAARVPAERGGTVRVPNYDRWENGTGRVAVLTKYELWRCKGCQVNQWHCKTFLELYGTTVSN